MAIGFSELSEALMVTEGFDKSWNLVFGCNEKGTMPGINLDKAATLRPESRFRRNRTSFC